jgi:serine/threonine protein kinase
MAEPAQLKMVPCEGCGTKNFIPATTPRFQTVPCSECQHPVMMPVMLKQFELRSVIASGGMGTVFRAFDIILEREVAVKLLQKEFAQDALSMSGFLREARACAGLNHTHIIHIHNFDEHEGRKFLVMELADRGSLDGRLEKTRRVDELLVLDVGIKIAGALDAVHRHGLLHLDVKPGNILFNAEGEPKLVDFGLVKRVGETSLPDEELMGTPFYIAPERVEYRSQDFRSDLYSLAATLYHAATGRVPFDAGQVHEVAVAHVHEPLVPPNNVFADLTRDTNDAIVRAMEKDPAQRFPSCDEFIMALTAARSRLLVKRFG